jgi:hypothetical protein
MYIFAKFVPDHIFFQKRDKLNIKKSALSFCISKLHNQERPWAMAPFAFAMGFGWLGGKCVARVAKQ